MTLTEDKLYQKQQQLIERTAKALTISESEARELLMIPRTQSVRINTLKTSIQDMTDMFSRKDIALVPSGWARDCFSISSGSEALRDSQEAENGSLYIQNAASWLPAIALNPQPGDTILDVCAAPGGKTSHIAQMAGNKALITANDNSRPRLMKLQRNMERLGVENIDYTLHDATRLAQKLDEASFDKILLDAPCSGEGMMTIDNKKDFESWSVAHIKRLQQLQKKIIVQAWSLLKPGGTLVYSTCTMAPEENEAVIDYLLRRFDTARVESLQSIREHLPAAIPPVHEWNGKQFNPDIQKALRLTPSKEVEAFFVVKLTKAFEA